MMNKYTIRKIRSLDELLRVWVVIEVQIAQYITDPESHVSDLKKHFTKNGDLMFLIEDDGRIVGGALGFGNTLRVIAIAPEHRGRGLGRRMMQIYEYSAMKNGLHMVCLGSDPENREFYIRQGYHGKKSLMKEFPLPGRVLDLKLHKLADLIGDLDSGHEVCVEEGESIPALSPSI